MAHQIVKVENKNNDWKVVEILNAAGDLIPNVSVNRTSKKGDVFPNFDTLKAGDKVEGRLWESPAGKTYLFPPKDAPKAPATPETNDFAVSNAEIKNLITLKVIPYLVEIREAQKNGEKKVIPYPAATQTPNFGEDEAAPF